MKVIVDSPHAPIADFVFAHGAGANKNSDFMQTMTQNLVELGIRVIRFDFPYMIKAQQTGRRHPPNKMPMLQDDFMQVLADHKSELPLFVGGKSMGGRVATMLPDFTAVSGIVCLGYPFHPPGKSDKLRTEHLFSITKPVLVIQGERDTFGNRAEVTQYGLPDNIEIAFLAAADHSFVPLRSTNIDPNEHLRSAATRMTRFIQEHL